MEVIREAKHADLDITAKLHGVKLRPYIKPLKLSKEERESANSAAVSVYDRMKREHKERCYGEKQNNRRD